MIVAVILALLPVAGFVFLLLFSDMGGNEPTRQERTDASTDA